MVMLTGAFVKGRRKNSPVRSFQAPRVMVHLSAVIKDMIRIQNIPLPIGGDLELLRKRAARTLGVRPGALEDLRLVTSLSTPGKSRTCTMCTPWTCP